MFKSVQGLVLREVKYKEADKILTVLTEEGKLTVRARGALRRHCRVSASAQQLVYSEMTLFNNRGKWTMDEAEPIDAFPGLRTELELLSLGVYVAELLETLSDEDLPSPELLRLGLNTLYALSNRLRPPELIKAGFELRLMCATGYAPMLYACSRCGAEEPEQPVLSLDGGVLLCARCCTAADKRRAALCPASLEAMRYISAAPLRRLFSFQVSDAACDRLCSAAEAYLLAQLDRGFASLDYYKSLLTFRG